VPGTPERRTHRLTLVETKVALGITKGATDKELSELLGISPAQLKVLKLRTMSKMAIAAEILEANAERSAAKKLVPAVESVINKAVEVIGDRDEAMRWLGTPVRALDYATPISLLGTKKGAARVEDVLGRMEHGVW